MVRQLSARNTITLPAKVLKEIGSKPGDFFEIEHDGTCIILVPKAIEDKLTDLEWEKLGKLSKEKGKVYTNAKDAKEHLKGLINEI
ncbi:MAG: AbrB/MazE/SpoVT family DNA-binding domain-containing protein [Actinobacteria bacterium]|nr:AbrB/MazE/SpoVT family DNA-binding domain-containing protein [Actinomycetota bacterium]